MLIRLIMIILAALIIAPGQSFAIFGSSDEFESLSDLTASMAKEMKEIVPGSVIYLDREDIRNISDDSTAPFSSNLQRELESALGTAGFRFESSVVDKADFRITIRYQVDTDRVKISLRLKDTKDPTNSSYRTLKKRYWLALNKLPAESFTLSVDDYLGRLVKKILGNKTKARRGSAKLVINQTVEARKGYSSPFGEYVTQRLKTLFAGDANITVIEEKPVTSKIAAKRTTSEKGVAGTDALLAGADAVLVDTWLCGNESLILAASMKDQNGTVIARADENIPLSLVKHSLENDTAEQIAIFADTEHEKPNELVSIRTTKGGGQHEIFRAGETVQFALKVARALYVYIYDINPKGDATLLYPKEGEQEQPLAPDIIFTIPEASDSWEIKVEPPFGTDAVKLFASNRKLPLPKISNEVKSLSFNGTTRSLIRQDKLRHELAEQKIINGRDLVDYYKGIATSLKAPLHEATIFVETREK